MEFGKTKLLSLDVPRIYNSGQSTLLDRNDGSVHRDR
jgi:hypothetical protein